MVTKKNKKNARTTSSTNVWKSFSLFFCRSVMSSLSLSVCHRHGWWTRLRATWWSFFVHPSEIERFWTCTHTLENERILFCCFPVCMSPINFEGWIILSLLFFLGKLQGSLLWSQAVVAYHCNVKHAVVQLKLISCTRTTSDHAKLTAADLPPQAQHFLSSDSSITLN